MHFKVFHFIIFKIQVLTSKIRYNYLLNLFLGDYSDADVLLYGNNLEFFDQAVFMEMLSQMDGGSGYLDVGQSINFSS